MRLSSNPDHIRKAAGDTAAGMTEATVEFLSSLTGVGPELEALVTFEGA